MGITLAGKVNSHESATQQSICWGARTVSFRPFSPQPHKQGQSRKAGLKSSISKSQSSAPSWRKGWGKQNTNWLNSNHKVKAYGHVVFK